MHADELARFVDSLAIPTERKEVVLAELTDHLASAREAAVRAGRDPETATLGDLEALRRSLETIEPAFRVSRRRAFVHGLAGGVLVAVAIASGGVMHGVIGAVAAIAIATAFAPRPRHSLELLRRELRAPRVRRSVRIGPMLTYIFTIYSVPFLVWITLIAVRATAYGVTSFVVPWSAFAIAAVTYVLLFVEIVRARQRPKAAA